MFWKKKPEELLKLEVEKLPRPKEIPKLVGRNLVVEKKQDPDWIWKLKGVVRKRLQEGKDTFDVGIFDEAQVSVKNVTVKDYNSLDEHPDLILYEGWFDKKSMKVQIKEKERACKNLGYE